MEIYADLTLKKWVIIPTVKTMASQQVQPTLTSDTCPSSGRYDRYGGASEIRITS